MSEFSVERRIGDIQVRAYGIEPTRRPNISSFSISFGGESERLRLTTLEEVRDLHYAIGRIIAEVEERAGTP